MGVTILHHYPILDGKSGPQITEYLCSRLAVMGAVQSGHFIVDCETYFAAPAVHGQPAKAVSVLHDSEYPATTFSILDTGTKQIPLVADNLFDLFMIKIKKVYSSKKQTKIESKGPRYELGDFLIKIGSVTMMENFKGILIEIEYRPCVVFSNCWEMIREILNAVIAQVIPNSIPPYFGTPSILGHPNQKQNDNYQPIDTINQYLEQFNNFRKQPSMAQNPSSTTPGLRST